MNSRINPIVHLYVFDTMADWEAAFAIAAINNPRFHSSTRRFRVVTAAPKLAPVTTIGGVRIQPEVSLDSVTPASSAMLILPGGDAWQTGANAEVLQLVSRFIASGVPVAAICSATLALARAGLLDHLRLTGNSREYLISSGYRGAGFYCGAPGLSVRNTSAETDVTPIDFAREIFRMLNIASASTPAAWYDQFIQPEASNYRASAMN